MRARRLSLLIVLLAFTACPAWAQPFTLDDTIKPTEIKLEPYKTGDPKTEGRMYGASISQSEPARYFFLQGVSIYSPVYVGVTADDPSTAVQVALHKENWNQPHLRGDTGSRGHWDARFKTSGDFGIRVASDHPAKYALLIWVGNEVNAPMPSPFTHSKTSSPTSASPASNNNLLLYIIIAALAGALVAVVFMKSKSPKACILIGALAASSLVARPAFAQYDKAVASMLSDLKQFLSEQESVDKFWQSLKTLSQSETQPNEPQTGPSLPSSCVDDAWALPSNPGCQCMATAVDKLRRNRQMLEKLRILVANQKNFVDKAIALGNSYAQLHTVLGLQWVGIRRHDIEEPHAEFKQISKQKHQALMDAIQKDLQDVSACEEKLGERDWYQKFGFMYYEFLYAAYKPAF
jgi:hypothetical protein